jgi:hypothetical protein
VFQVTPVIIWEVTARSLSPDSLPEDDDESAADGGVTARKKESLQKGSGNKSTYAGFYYEHRDDEFESHFPSTLPRAGSGCFFKIRLPHIFDSDEEVYLLMMLLFLRIVDVTVDNKTTATLYFENAKRRDFALRFFNDYLDAFSVIVDNRSKRKKS